MTTEELVARISAGATGSQRFIVAIAGPPGAGKSTLATDLAQKLGSGARVVPMDGYHLDDAVLAARGLRHRKGAPETFDVQGFLHLLDRLRREEEVAIPIFDRTLELSRAAADVVTADDRILLVEGNYLLLRDPPWSGAARHFDLTVFVDVPLAELEARLIRRWAFYGKTPEEARAWIDGNDMPNIRTVIERSAPAIVRMAES
ncbi:MAG TPA: nucleoside triphosphate hydrolase [Paracoccaceae bacterium]|nr:nucleoside triphosphate hydrolase [Paracoccaceae bacterium]